MHAAPQTLARGPKMDPSGWIRRGPPGLGLWDPASLSDADVHTLWQFRLRYVDLKPDVDPRDDLAAYTSFLGQASHVWVWLDRQELIGTALHHTRSVDFAGELRHFVQSDYGFIARRGRALAMLSQAWVYARLYFAKLRSPTYVVGFVYPQSFLVYAGTLSACRLLGESTMSAEERRFAEQLARDLGGKGWDPDRLRYAFPTHPRERQIVAAHPGRAAALARYEALNPDWHDGYGLFFFAPMSLNSIREAGRSLLSRRRRSRRRARAEPSAG